MPEHFSPISASSLLKIMMHNEKQHHIFGIPTKAFYKPSGFSFPWNKNEMHTPIGVAAGPHTQLAQNIISAWLCGARFIELKTVQTLDELKIPRPCIDAPDEGYNCEWSQELRIPQSFQEYLKAWVLIHVLAHKFGYSVHGTVFNMSIGYNLEGIKKENVQWFLEKMKHCPDELNAVVQELLPIYPALKDISISSCLSDSVTLSTMHGCPPDEIEKIGMYLIKEKKLNTIIKLNPTLLGPERMRGIIAELGHTTHIPDEAFNHDLKFEDAKSIITNLRKAAAEENLFFGVKLTNTLECENKRKILPEEIVYMSGRILHPLSVAVAKLIRENFGNQLPLSFSAGGDCFNINDLLSCGLFPVTVCTDLLRPGGYSRMKQYTEEIENALKQYSASNLNDFVKMKAGNSGYSEALEINLDNYSYDTINGDDYRKSIFREPPPKSKRTLPQFDCIKAPCMEGCPANQDIPEYLHFASLEQWDEAMRVIFVKNPFPNVLGKVCDHECQTRCTRSWYDNAILIRDVKRVIAEKNFTPASSENNNNKIKVAVIGAGPAGLACSYFLKVAGFSVDIFEQQTDAGGMAARVIPQFRLDKESLLKDIQHIVSSGVNIEYNKTIDQKEFEELRNKYNYIFVATGTPQAKQLTIPGAEHKDVTDALSFLAEVKKNSFSSKPKNIVILGGGNSAVDAARTAKRLADGNVTLAYRRSRTEMPALQEEIEEMILEGITLLEMTSPLEVKIENNFISSLLCIKNELGQPDASGRRAPVSVKGSEFSIPCDMVIHALGQESAASFVTPALTENNFISTKDPHIFIGGDLSRGPANIVKAVADGRAVAEAILQKEAGELNIGKLISKKHHDIDELMLKRAKRIKRAVPQFQDTSHTKSFSLATKTLTDEQAVYEAARCLHCDELCNICVTVCPNRANISYTIQPQLFPDYEVVNGIIETKGYLEFLQSTQVLNLADSCNECGNCVTFCPTSGKPWQDKPRLFLSKPAFDKFDNGFCFENVNGARTLFFKNEIASGSMQLDVHGYYRIHTPGISITLEKKTKEIILFETKETNVNLSFIPACILLFENVELY
ncbi:MAG: putative selenate reductase subunit YgfK [Bacteroidota bacterium]